MVVKTHKCDVCYSVFRKKTAYNRGNLCRHVEQLRSSTDVYTFYPADGVKMLQQCYVDFSALAAVFEHPLNCIELVNT